MLSLLVAVAACGSTNVDVSDVPELPEATFESVSTLLAESSKPVVLNVWASWCIPCRSEAPLLERAAQQFAGRVTFVGLNYRDSQDRARAFIAEFFPGAPIDHLIDRSDRIPIDLGGTFGVPQTFFYAPGGELVAIHPAVIDERIVALQIDEILARSG
jgi:cytochrome c biogenesis protein CcmG/thiol:disulfide interchange protein DsbE